MGSRLRYALVAACTTGLLLVAPAHATFPGDNGKIAYSGCGPIDCGVFTMNPDGSGRTQVTHNTYSQTFCGSFGCFLYQGRDQWPHWSPDGRKLVFSRDDADSVHLYTANADGSEVTQLTSSPTGLDYQAAWSPDGQRIAFIRHTNFVAGEPLFVMNVDGSGETQLVDDADAPDWSPDGSTIAYAASDGNSQFHFDIHMISPDGSNRRQITSSTGELGNRQPSWSPDGGHIAFARAACCGWNPDVAVMNPDGGGITNLTPGTPDDEDREPVYSPDGARIAYETARGDAQPQIAVMSADGSGTTLLGPGTQPDWQPLTGPRRADYQNASKFCKAEREFMGDGAFAHKYGAGANAHGKCVGRN